MKIDRILNNNCIVSIDDSGKERVVMGNGIGFSKKKGDSIDLSKIEKEFSLNSDSKNEIFKDLYRELSEAEIDVIVLIVDKAESVFNVKFGSNLYIALVDHISYAIERKKEDLDIKNPLTWQIKRFFKKELEVGEYALEVIKSKLGVELSEDEAASIALHIMNSKREGNLMPETIQVTKLMQERESIVRMS